MPSEDYTNNIKNLENSQRAENDNRKAVRECDLFLNKRDGQWEPHIAQQWAERPRYTFDQCNPVIDNILGEMNKLDFAIKVVPAGGGSTMKTAKTMAGLIRSIETKSLAKYTYADAAKAMVSTGLSGWRIRTAFRNNSSFHQDLLIEEIGNFRDRVWFDQGAVKPTMEDADECWILTSLAKDDYHTAFGADASGMSVSDDVEEEPYYDKKTDEVIVGEHLFKKTEKQTLLLMSNNQVYKRDENFLKVQDELANAQIVPVKEREVDWVTVHQRFFDGSDWLSESKPTVFEMLPIIPLYANFKLSYNKIIYWAATEKFMDPQRVLNYAESKKVAETALKPIAKTWVTKDQAKSADVKLAMSTQNTNNDPIQFYDHAPEQAPPFMPPSQQPDMVLIETAASSKQYITEASGLFDANKGVGLAGQSSLTVEKLQDRGDTSNYKYNNVLERALNHTARVLGPAIPKVYDTQQEISIINPDSTQEVVTLKEVIKDDQTGDIVELNDLAKGSYAFSYEMGPAYASKQQATVEGMVSVGNIDPSIMEMGSDILFSNLSGPHMDELAARKRRQLLMAGVIPPEQMTKEEKEIIKQAGEQSKEPTAVDKALLAQADAETTRAQANTEDIFSKIEERIGKMELEAQKIAIKQQEVAIKAQEQTDKREELMLKTLETNAAVLKTLKDSMGVEAIIAPSNVEAYHNQTLLVQESQAQQ